MNALAIDDAELLVDLADELAEDPGLCLMQLGHPHSRQTYILQVWGRDIARLSSQSFPCIQVQGAPGDIVQLSDPRGDCNAAHWQRQLKDSDYPGVTIYSCYLGGKLVQLVIQDGIEVYDADGARM